MSLINWLKAKNPKPLRSGSKQSGRDVFGQNTLQLVSPRRGRRLLRREQLSTVVRESMIRGGVLSTSYEFKILTLDANGESFLVLIDLVLPADVMPDASLLDIERWIQASAHARHSMSVPSVYWRRQAAHDQQGMAVKAAVAAQTQSPVASEGAMAIPSPPVSGRVGEGQPVEADETEAFRQALECAEAPLHRGPPGSSDMPSPMLESFSDFAALSDPQYGKR